MVPRPIRTIVLAALTAATTLACSDAPVSPGRVAGADVASWSTWVLPSASSVRPAAPPADGSAQTLAEIDEIVRLQAQRTAATDSIVRFWSADPIAPWSEVAVGRLDFYWPLLPDVQVATPVRASRIMALLHVAMYDAMVAAWEAKYAYARRAPARASDRVRAIAPLTGAPSYPSEHAAAAAAAVRILSYAFPLEDATRWTNMAREQMDAHVLSGAAYPSDVEAGYALGDAVAQRVFDRAMIDGSAEQWTGSVPTGEGMWAPTPPRRLRIPLDALAGDWKTWVLPSGDVFRPAPPPAVGSPAFETDLAELMQLADGGRTLAQIEAARFWATDAPSIRWELFMADEIQRHRLSIPHAARARAYLSVAMYDAFVACWDAKYHYWLARPITMNPALRTVFSTPPFPSYPSGHSTQSAAAAEVMAELFPSRARAYHDEALEASLSRVWGGVHYRFDVVAGEALGKKVGEAVVERMRGDGEATR